MHVSHRNPPVPIFDLNLSISDLIEFHIPPLERITPVLSFGEQARLPLVGGGSEGVAFLLAEAKT